MLKTAAGRGVGPSVQRPLGSTCWCIRSCARTPQLRSCAEGARAAPAVAPYPCPSSSSRSRHHTFGGALARARQQQQARMINSGVQAAAASPRGDGGVLRRNSGSGTPQGSAQGSETAAAVNAAAFAAQLLPRLEGVEGETGAMEERIVQRVEAQVAALRSELLMALWEREDAAKQQPAAAAAEVAALRSELQALAQRQEETEGRVAAAAAAGKQGATPAAVLQSVVQLANSYGEWTEQRLLWLAKRVVVFTFVAVYAALFLGAVITFFTTLANMDMALADKAITLLLTAFAIFSMGVIVLTFP